MKKYLLQRSFPSIYHLLVKQYSYELGKKSSVDNHLINDTFGNSVLHFTLFGIITWGLKYIFFHRVLGSIGLPAMNS